VTRRATRVSVAIVSSASPAPGRRLHGVPG
jgi:hypothetical protein